MTLSRKAVAGFMAVCMSVSACIPYAVTNNKMTVANAVSENIADTMTWGTMKIGGAGFVSGIIRGQNEMYLRTDVGGAYKWNYETSQWEQLMAFINEADRGLLSVKGIAIDPTDDNTAYFLCGCAYFSDARTVIFKTTDGGKTFTESDVTEHIQVHGNGDGRECIEPIAVDPDNPDIIYAGGDVTAGKSALIKSTDGGKTWNPVMSYDALGLFSGTLKYPSWTENMVRGTEPSKEYNAQNGIGCILIQDGKVYVGTSVTGQTNIHVANVEDDEFTELSPDLPTDNYPCSITNDGNGNIFFTYIAGLAFSGGAGGAYKYDTTTGDVTCFDELSSAIGMIEADADDPNKLVARTCGLWSDQWYEKEWVDGSIAYGDHFYRSTDAGETWEDITPGQGETIYGEGEPHKEFLSLPIDTNGYDWIYGKSCHWGSSIVIDPRNPDRILLTSGNGVFACDNVWDEKEVQFYFQPDGVEEVVVLDFTSVPGGSNYSAIGDYDGFIHNDVNEIGIQYKPNMGSTSGIAYCPQNPDVMIRIAQGDSNNAASGYYTLDGGKTWNGMSNNSGGKCAIAQTGDGEYRFFVGKGDDGTVSYSDDFGETWNECKGIPTQYGSKPTYLLVDPENPDIVYAYATYYNSSWFYSKDEPDISDACYKFCISTDGGKNFTSTDICIYDMCDSAARIAYLGSGELILGAGWNGMYHLEIKDGKITENEKLKSVSYCKTVGYGAPEKDGEPNTLFMYGKPSDSDPEGVYRSQDGGNSWVCINTDYLYGGTGNGNFLVGDMNEFGKVYMSTVGCGIVYGALSDDDTDPKPQTTTTTSKNDDKTTTTTTKAVSGEKVTWGDADESGDVNINDTVLVMQSIANPDGYKLSEQGKRNADVVDNGSGITNSDSLAIQYIESKTIKTEDLPITSEELDKISG